MATATRPPATTGPGTTATPVMHTPPVTRSRPITWIVIIFLAFVLLSGATIAWMNSRKHNKNNWNERSSGRRPDQKYNVATIAYGETLTFKVKPGHSALVEFTNDYCPMWSNGQIDTYNANGEKRVLEGKKFIQGSYTSIDNPSMTYVNKTKNSITIKIERWTSIESSKTQF